MNLKALDMRCKLLFIPYHLVLDSILFLIYRNKNLPEKDVAFKSLHLVLQGLPDGTEVHRCHLPEARLGLIFELWHPSFDVVKQSDMAPEIKWEATVAVAENPYLPDAYSERLEVIRQIPIVTIKNNIIGTTDPVDPLDAFFSK